MTAQRLASFRSGDLNEELGLLLLKAFAVVAPVPRQEDVGLDAVATLMRRSERMLIAEDSFYVQLKSSSIRKIEYKGEHEVKWFRELQLPLFIGSVDRTTFQINLYPAHNARVAILSGENSPITMCLDAASQEDKVIWLGEPLLTWTIVELNSDDFGEKAYSLLKQYLAHEQKNLGHGDIRTVGMLFWKTNELVTQSGYQIHNLRFERQETVSTIQSIRQPLLKVALAMQMEKDVEGSEKMLRFLEHIIDVRIEAMSVLRSTILFPNNPPGEGQMPSGSPGGTLPGT